jgi:hypothetical protein
MKITFEKNTKTSGVVGFIGNKISFIDRFDPRINEVNPYETWEVEIKGESPDKKVFFLRLLKSPKEIKEDFKNSYNKSLQVIENSTLNDKDKDIFRKIAKKEAVTEERIEKYIEFHSKTTEMNNEIISVIEDEKQPLPLHLITPLNIKCWERWFPTHGMGKYIYADESDYTTKDLPDEYYQTDYIFPRKHIMWDLENGILLFRRSRLKTCLEKNVKEMFDPEDILIEADSVPPITPDEFEKLRQAGEYSEKIRTKFMNYFPMFLKIDQQINDLNEKLTKKYFQDKKNAVTFFKGSPYTETPGLHIKDGVPCYQDFLEGEPDMMEWQPIMATHWEDVLKGPFDQESMDIRYDNLIYDFLKPYIHDPFLIDEPKKVYKKACSLVSQFKENVE